MSISNPAAQAAELRLPETFAFSQSSLQAYDDCPRRFWLAFVEQLPWPAVEASPVQEHEQAMRLGALFHRLVQRAESGPDSLLTPDLLAAGLEPPLAGWFDAYRRARPHDLGAALEVERVLSIPFAANPAPRSGPGDAPPAAAAPATPPGGKLPVGLRLAAKYDLIAATAEGRIVIVDWKTGRRRGKPAALRMRLQSIVYPYVLVEASAALPWGPIAPEQVEMRYWFTAAPEHPVTFRYDGEQHAANGKRLHEIIREILAGRTEADFPKVPDTEANRRRFCRFCVYRSRCDRGLDAGPLEDADDPDTLFVVDAASALEFTLEQVEELEF